MSLGIKTMNTMTKDLKIAMAKEITAAYVRNEAAKPTPEQAAEMLTTIYKAIEALSPDESSNRKVGLGI
jgi:hypothetical protein